MLIFPARTAITRVALAVLLTLACNDASVSEEGVLTDANLEILPDQAFDHRVPDVSSQLADEALTEEMPDALSGDASSHVTDGESSDSGTSFSDRDAIPSAWDQSVEPPSAYLQLSADRPMLGLEQQGESLSLRCRYISAEGLVLPAPDDIIVDIEGEGVSQIGDRWRFSDYGSYLATCRSNSLNLETSESIIVHFDGLDYRYVDQIKHFYEAGPAYQRLVSAYESRDGERVGEQLERLREIGDKLHDLSQVDWIAPHPIQSWPGPSEMDGAGLVINDNDQRWIDALDAFDGTLSRHIQFWVDLNPSALDEITATNFSNELGELRSLATQMTGRPVSARTVWLERDRLGAINRKLLTAASYMHERIVEFYASPLPESRENGFVGASFLSAIILQSALIIVEEQFEDISYTRMLRDVGVTAAASLAQDVIRRLLNLNLDVSETPVEIQSLHGPAGGFIGGGNEFYARGRFPGPLSSNRFIIIPPRYTQFASNITDALFSLQDIWSSPKIVMKAQEVQRVVNAIARIMVAEEDLDGLDRFHQFMGIAPEEGDGALVRFSALPRALNCSRFMLPAVGTVIPLNLSTGPGLAVNVNFYGEPDGTCD